MARPKTKVQLARRYIPDVKLLVLVGVLLAIIVLATWGFSVLKPLKRVPTPSFIS